MHTAQTSIKPRPFRCPSASARTPRPHRNMHCTANDTCMARRRLELSSQFSLHVLHPSRSWEGVSLESSCFLHFVAKEEILQPLLACTLVSTTHGFFSLPRSVVLFAPAFPKHNPESLAQKAAPQANSWELATTTSDLASPCESHYAGISSHLWALIPICGGRQSLQQGIE